MPTKINTLTDVFYESLRDLYHAEKQLVKALPKMAKAATCEELSAGFKKHLHETEGHVARLEQVFSLIGREAKPKPCEAMKGLVEEGKEAIEANTANGILTDELLVNAARKVEHYELATYCTLQVWAEKLNLPEVGKLLKQTYDEEQAADNSLKEHAGQDADTLQHGNVAVAKPMIAMRGKRK
jgi:ferritin-like metal-binding protein YciE